jgi:hypothetical protein
MTACRKLFQAVIAAAKTFAAYIDIKELLILLPVPKSYPLIKFSVVCDMEIRVWLMSYHPA